MIIYGLKTCDSCRKALKSLPNATFVDVRETGRLPPDVLERALATFPDKLVNTRSTTWRNLSESERGRAPHELLTTHPTLMKRPLIDTKDALYLGWGKDVQTALT